MGRAVSPFEQDAWWLDRPAARPLPVTGGIKARNQRGAIGQSWWSARFVAVLESLGVGGRLGRGRSYARAGQVISLEVGPGSVRAQVQGSRPRPYRVRIGLPTFGKAEWARVEQAMADSAWYTAKLLAGEMPEDIEKVFEAVGLTLFPASARELSLDCTCPDQQVPCKHLAAVFYLLAESFDADPFEMLALRGRDRDTLLDNIRARRDTAHPGQPGPGVHDPGADVPALAECLADYFHAPARLPALAAPRTPPDAVLDQLPPVELRVGNRPLADLLRPAYRALAEPE
jgi:uncharacterized Zn finger protein